MTPGRLRWLACASVVESLGLSLVLDWGAGAAAGAPIGAPGGVAPASLTLVLGEVYRAISRHLLCRAGLTSATAATGAVTLVRRFGSALNLKIQSDMS